MGKSAWTESNIALLRELWAENKLSASQISAQLGCGISRNAVLGQVHRLGLESHQKPFVKGGKRRQEQRQRKIRKPREWKPPAPPPVRVIEIPPLNIGFFDLEPSHCRYPANEDNPFLFCGHTKQADSSYCPHHHRLCHTTPEKRQPSALLIRSRRKMFAAAPLVAGGGTDESAEFTEVAA